MTLKEAVNIMKNHGYRIIEAHHFYERLEPLNDKELLDLQEEFKNNPKLQKFLTTRLIDMPLKYRHLDHSQFGLAKTLLYFIQGFMDDVDEPHIHSYFIKDGDQFLGFIYYIENKDDLKIVEDCGAFDFDVEETNNTKFQDIVKFPLDLLKTHDIVRWKVFNENPIKRGYDLFIKKNKGTSYEKDGQTFYELKN